ncbi:MAG: hypothetical protein ACP5TL_00660 [Candidatus Micrarchaeia archaeon]
MLTYMYLMNLIGLHMPLFGLVFTPTTWLPIAFIAVMIVFFVAGIVYMLSTILDSSNAKNWARSQIYEAFLSIILIVIFGAFSYLFFLNPQGAFGPSGLNIIPLNLNILGFTSAGCNSATDIFQLSTCDLAQFNGVVSTTTAFIYYASFVIGITPTLNMRIESPSSPEIYIGVSDFEIYPAQIDNILTLLYSGMIFALLLSQLQLIILSGALLFLSFFLTLGLIMRTFGLTKTFGGALIAFGLGLGFVYPLLTSITYGFIDTNVISTCNGVCGVGLMFGAIVSFILSYLMPSILVPYSILNAGVVYLGYLIAGLTFIPFLNFTIVDAFIVDFSKAIGERMDFMSLLTNII